MTLPVAGGAWCRLLGGLSEDAWRNDDHAESVAEFVREAIEHGALDPNASLGTTSLLACAVRLAGRVRQGQRWRVADVRSSQMRLASADDILGGTGRGSRHVLEDLPLLLISRGARVDGGLDDALHGRGLEGGKDGKPMPAAGKWSEASGLEGAHASAWLLAMQYGLPDILSAILHALPRESVVVARTPEGVPWVGALLAEGYEACARMLLLAGADPNACDAEGRGLASYARSSKAIEMLVEFGAQFAQAAREGLPPVWEDWRRAGIGVGDIADMRAALPAAVKKPGSTLDSIMAGRWPGRLEAFGDKPVTRLALDLGFCGASDNWSEGAGRVFRSGLSRLLQEGDRRASGGEADGEALLRTALAGTALNAMRYGRIRTRFALCKKMFGLAESSGSRLFPLTAQDTCDIRASADWARTDSISERERDVGMRQVIGAVRDRLMAGVVEAAALESAARCFAGHAGGAMLAGGRLEASERLASLLLTMTWFLPDATRAADISDRVLAALPAPRAGRALIEADHAVFDFTDVDLRTPPTTLAPCMQAALAALPPARALAWLEALAGEAAERRQGVNTTNDDTTAAWSIERIAAVFGEQIPKWPATAGTAAALAGIAKCLGGLADACHPLNQECRKAQALAMACVDQMALASEGNRARARRYS